MHTYNVVYVATVYTEFKGEQAMTVIHNVSVLIMDFQVVTFTLKKIFGNPAQFVILNELK